MTDENSALLQRYAAGKSEAAFSDLVQRNINMVYSAALRQTGGDASAAEDITQAVFTDLARKAPLLTGHSSVTGWLYTSTRFLAAKTRRAEQRRRAREHQAHVMNQILESPGSDPAWEELRPVIDDAMQDLSAADRETVLLRYFDGQRLAEIGTRLGISENAARMRVDRAIDKLREALARRGVTSTAAAVGSLLARNAVKAAPAGLSARVSHAAWKSSSFGPMAGILALLPSFKVQLAVVSAVLVLGSASFMFLRSSAGGPGGRVAASSSTSDQDSAPEPSGRGSSGTQADDLSGALASEPVNTNTLLLEIVSADSGKPIPSVTISAWIWHSKKIDAKKFHATQPGICEVRLPEDKVTQLTLASHADGFADTRLEWRTERGQTIPQRYTLRVARATPLGGRVVDADGNPVADAEVGFNNETSPAQEGTGPQTDNFGWPFWVTARTDDQGRWRIDRVAAEAVRTLYGSASHSNYVATQTVWLNKDSGARQELLEGTHTFSLGRAVAVSGMVITQEGQAVPGATVLVGNIGSRDRREAKSAPDGSFTIAGCKPGKNLLSANAKGFAPVTLETELTADRQRPAFAGCEYLRAAHP
jgi:RNA polymerase sigma factor (sigma-70 family)